MNTVALIAASVAGLLHAGFFYLESIAFSRPETYRRFRVRSADEAAVIRPWAFNQGFYNLFLGIGALVGVVIFAGGRHGEGRALIALATASMLGAAVVLLATDRRMARPAAIQGTFPLIALVLLW
ncbi:MAG: putative rane protein [Pseudonocardiales bacterium]|jgi:putative membrane protein|nr:putative rane protein [Pseudonocardiales bacterium]